MGERDTKKNGQCLSAAGRVIVFRSDDICTGICTYLRYKCSLPSQGSNGLGLRYTEETFSATTAIRFAQIMTNHHLTGRNDTASLKHNIHHLFVALTIVKSKPTNSSIRGPRSNFPDCT